jgi:hypothetical protein
MCGQLLRPEAITRRRCHECVRKCRAWAEAGEDSWREDGHDVPQLNDRGEVIGYER